MPTLRPLALTLFVAVTGCGAAPPSASATPTKAAATTSADASAPPVADTIALAMTHGFPEPRSALAHTRELAMFDDQIAPLRALAARTDERLAAITSARKDAMTELGALFDATPPDDAAIRAKLATISGLDADAVRVSIEARIETRRILRPEQIIKLRALRSATTL